MNIIMNPDNLQNLIKPYLESEDTINIQTEDNIHFDILIISNKFNNIKLIDRQKMIYRILKPFIISGTIHAMKFNIFTKDEYNKIN